MGRKRKPQSRTNYEGSGKKGFSKRRREGRVRNGMPAEPTYCDNCGLEECDQPDCEDDCAFCMAHEDC